MNIPFYFLRFRTTSLAVYCAAILATAVRISSAKLVDKMTFESGTGREAQAFDACGKQGSTKPCPACTPENALTVQSDIVSIGKYAGKAWLPKCYERAEWRMRRDAFAGGEYWYGWSMYLPKNFSTGSWYAILAQIHHRQYDPCTPSGADHVLIANGGNMRFAVRGPKRQQSETIERVQNYLGIWTHFVLHIKYRADNQGFYHFWQRHENQKEYKKVISRQNMITIPCSKAIFFFKFGIYLGDPDKPIPNEITAYFDNYFMGDQNSSFEEVRPDQPFGSTENISPIPARIVPQKTSGLCTIVTGETLPSLRIISRGATVRRIFNPAGKRLP